MTGKTQSVFRGKLTKLTAQSVSLVLGISLATLSSTAIAAKQITLGGAVWVGFAPFYVAEAQGYFKKYGVNAKLTFFNDPAMITSALTSDSIQGAMVTYDQVIGQASKGVAVKIVMPVDYSYGADAIVATKEITSIKDLKGKKVGYAPLSPSDFLLSYALMKNNLSEKDITPINIAPEAVPAALASKQLAIGVTYEPSLSQIVNQDNGKKYHVVYSSKDAPGLIADVFVFTEKFISSNRKDVGGMIKAYVDGLTYIKSNPEESAKIVGKYVGVSASEAKQQLSGVYLIPLNEMPKAFVKSQDTTSFHTSGEVIGKLLVDKGQIAKQPEIETILDSTFFKVSKSK